MGSEMCIRDRHLSTAGPIRREQPNLPPARQRPSPRRSRGRASNWPSRSRRQLAQGPLENGRLPAALLGGPLLYGQNTDAICNELPPLARHGQNERGVALGRKSWLFAGSERGADRAAFMYTLIQTAKLNDIDPQAWLADVLARIADIPQCEFRSNPATDSDFIPATIPISCRPPFRDEAGHLRRFRPSPSAPCGSPTEAVLPRR